ncbi:hypothetical protein ACFP81_00890 [Deinococcus lacus]|uniref:Uncharacterized protein n=1 Tax=Deinococcus lacus TaxID=392561 RepID=A0ABW1YBC9_9DEIO
MTAQNAQLLRCLRELYGELVMQFAASLMGDSDDWHWGELAISGWPATDSYWHLLPERIGFNPILILGENKDKYGWNRNALWYLLVRCSRRDWAWLCTQIAGRLNSHELRWDLICRLKSLFEGKESLNRSDLLIGIEAILAADPRHFIVLHALPPVSPRLEGNEPQPPSP